MQFSSVFEYCPHILANNSMPLCPISKKDKTLDLFFQLLFFNRSLKRNASCFAQNISTRKLFAFFKMLLRKDNAI